MRCACHASRRPHSNLAIAAAYYPDGRQEALIKSLAMYESLDMMHAMVYDQGGAQHSSMQFAKEAIARRCACPIAKTLTDCENAD